MWAEPTGLELLRFSITFIMSWKIWTDVTLVLSWFETDDVLARLEILFEIACLLGYVELAPWQGYAKVLTQLDLRPT